jgi:hypothetical protein
VTTSALAVRQGSQTPRVGNYPPYVQSAAPEVIELAARTGLILDEWQRYILTHGLGMTATGGWSAPKVSVWVPRQNGKGGIIEALELAWLFLFDEPEIVHSAHEHRTSAKAYRRMERLIRNTPDLHRLVRPYGDKPDKPGYRKANGEQQIELHDGRLLQYSTRSGTAARGFSSPKIILDEGQELDEDQMAAILPTVSAMPNWQVWFLGTPPRTSDAWAYGLRDDGENGAPRLAHFDWGAGDLTDTPECRRLVDDPETAWRTNPAMGIRIDEETVQDERRPSGLGVMFPFERLGMWKPRATSGGVIDTARWEALGDSASRRDGDVALAVDIAPERDWAAIGVFGRRADGLGHLQLIRYQGGTDWVVPALVELRGVLDPVAIGMGRGTHASLKEALKKAGFMRPEDRPVQVVRLEGQATHPPQRGDLAVLSGTDMAAACGQLIDAVRDETLRHVPADQVIEAVKVAKTRAAGDSIAWARTDRSVDITALVALTEARWAFYARIDEIEDYDPAGDLF